MRLDLTEQLVTQFPAIFSPRFYFECGNGWFGLIQGLCNELMQAGKPPVATQVKEKFGTLRFYVEAATDKQHDIIGVFERNSEHICETCGQLGKIYTTRGWVRTRCENCRTS